MCLCVLTAVLAGSHAASEQHKAQHKAPYVPQTQEERELQALCVVHSHACNLTTDQYKLLRDLWYKKITTGSINDTIL